MSELSYLEKLLDGVEVEWKTLGQTCKIETGKLNANAAVDDGEYMFFTTAKETSKIDKFRWDTEALLIAGNANVGEVKHYIGKFEAYQRTYVLTNFDENVSVRFLYFVLSHSLKKYLEERTNSAAMTYIVLSTLENFPIPIPCPGNPQKSLAIQSEIVRILDKFTALTAELTAELTARKKQYNYYRDQLLSFDEEQEKPIYLEKMLDGVEVEWIPLGDIFDVFAGGDVPKDSLSDIRTDEYPIPILSNGIGGKSLYGWTNQAKITLPSLTISARGTIGWTSYRDEPFFPIVRLLVLTPKVELNLKFSYYFMKMIENDYKVPATGIPQLTKPMIKDIKIPIPCPDNPEKSLAIQSEIVRILDKFDTLTNSITEGLPREIELRQKQYEYYRDLLFSFPKPDSVTN
ncbi:TPA: restriction endonuclease subunit S [Escherichia coli]|uniref:restriction endonuclease subunit S n=1 Tax=Escherichia coli TaxID=562 RepID=UPI003890436E|nr:restriction endonuclease subunit S [Escherichia coli]HCB3742645.1 restriction endonuclease subunit S [Escherichia coli]